MRHYFLATGIVVIAACLPLLWFIPIAASHETGATLSQFLGSGALIVMAISMIIATRLPGTSMLFGPLDRAYVLHKWLGVSAMIAILLHDTIDADMQGLGKETLLVNFGETLGELSLYGLLALVLLSVATFTPYKLWKLTHRFMGAFFVAGAIHYFFILKPFDVTEPLGLYIGFFCIAGILAYIYATVSGLFFHGKHFKVVAAERNGDALAIVLRPNRGKMSAKAGQFAFISVENIPEPHPFTISKLSTDGDIRFTVKNLGDYTGMLQRSVKPGMSVRVKGPYGGFTRHKGTPEIWIAAGVGITPFMAWAQKLDANDSPIHLIYSVRQRSGASHLDELNEICNASSLQLHLHETASEGRLSFAELKKLVGEDFKNASVSFCGPAEMRADLQKQFIEAGLSPGSFHYEMFELRSGVGFRKLVSWILKYLNKRKTNDTSLSL